MATKPNSPIEDTPGVAKEKQPNSIYELPYEMQRLNPWLNK